MATNNSSTDDKGDFPENTTILTQITENINNNDCMNRHNIINYNEPIIRRRRHVAKQRRTGLLQYANDITSQNGEDGIIQYIFNKILIRTSEQQQQQPNNNNNNNVSSSAALLSLSSSLNTTTTTTGSNNLKLWCIDIGAWDGIHLSNTRQLLLQSDIWNGILIEADDNKFQQLQQLYSSSHNNNNNSITTTPSSLSSSSLLLSSSSSTINTNKLQSTNDNVDNNNGSSTPVSLLSNSSSTFSSSNNQIVHCIHATVSSDTNSKDSIVNLLQPYHNEIPYDIDFLCIDIDGLDYWILYNLLYNSIYRPKVICIEYNPSMPYDLIYIPACNDSIRHGCSLASLVELVEPFNYVLVVTTLYNAFFVAKTTIYEPYLQDIVPDPTLEGIVGYNSNSYANNNSMKTSIYQLYDGTMKLWGCKKLLWHRIPMDETKLSNILLVQNTSSATSTTSSNMEFPFRPNNSNNNDIAEQSTKKKTKKKQSQMNHHQSDTTQKDYPIVDTKTITDPNQVIVDVSSYCCNNSSSSSENASNNDATTKQQQQQIDCSDQLVDQFQKYGFCYVTGTGIDTTLCDDALHYTKEFFHIAANETIRRSCLSKMDRARRGYSPMNTENFASLLPNYNTDHTTNTFPNNDLVCKFRIGNPYRCSTDTGTAVIGKSDTTSLTTINNNNISTATETTLEKVTGSSSTSSSSSSSSSLLSPNIWPTTIEEVTNGSNTDNGDGWDNSDITTFQRTLEEYYIQADIVAHNILLAICDGLVRHYLELQEPIQIFRSVITHNNNNNNNNPEQSSSSSVDSNSKATHERQQRTNINHDYYNSSSILTILGYKPNTTRHKGKQKGKPLVAAHTDVGVITMLLFDQGNCATLQRMDLSSISTTDPITSNNSSKQIKWVDVTMPTTNHYNNNNKKKKEPIFVINIADCLSDITNGILPSTIHRVIPQIKSTGQQQEPRNCCALFVGFNSNDKILIGTELLSYEEWRKRRIERALQKSYSKTNNNSKSNNRNIDE